MGVIQNKEKPAFIKTERKFILYVGERNKYKNFKNLLKAYSNSKLLYENFSLICFGGGSFNQDEKNEFKSLKLNQIIFIKYQEMMKCYIPNMLVPNV